MTIQCAVCGKICKKKWETKNPVRFCSRACQTNEVARFWRSCEKRGPNDCWFWTKPLNERGYGYFSNKFKRTELAHRAAYRILVGRIPEGLEVCHNCPGGDNRNCVNPAHLFLGTHTENMQDASKKGTMAFGENSPVSILNNEIVRTIKLLFSSGARQCDIARQLNLRHDTISYVVHEKAWKHVTI